MLNLNEVKNKTHSINNLVTNASLHTKINEFKNKILELT